MKPETVEWVTKAEGDYRTACREIKVMDGPNYDAVCFHAQQCCEKFLKARLIEAGFSFPRTHDLEALLNQVLALEPSWEVLRTELQQLTDMAIEVRYPGLSADPEDAILALHAAALLRKLALASLSPQFLEEWE